MDEEYITYGGREEWEFCDTAARWDPDIELDEQAKELLDWIFIGRVKHEVPWVFAEDSRANAVNCSHSGNCINQCSIM